MAEWTGLEPATPGVTGRYSNQLNYHSALKAVLLPIPGVPTGIRTPVTAVKGRCPRPLDDGDPNKTVTTNDSVPGGGKRDRTADLLHAMQALSQLSYTPKPEKQPNHVKLAEWTGLEPATPGVTGRYSNQLNYHSAW